MVLAIRAPSRRKGIDVAIANHCPLLYNPTDCVSVGVSVKNNRKVMYAIHTKTAV
ncbi:hypothetical protein [Nostoc sp.]|uniref:hypothetical protein n=1 Tax=Nostoc sp. TaxID=1180 RepID=UPI002FF919ED